MTLRQIARQLREFSGGGAYPGPEPGKVFSTMVAFAGDPKPDLKKPKKNWRRPGKERERA